jgi:hypothetical protein
VAVTQNTVPSVVITLMGVAMFVKGNTTMTVITLHRIVIFIRIPSF